MSECEDSSICRGGCCRSFLGKQFCDVQSNCIDHPTWIIALVPALLGLAALMLIVVVLVRLNNRRVIQHYEHIKMQSEKQSQGTKYQQTDRNLISGQ